MRESIQDFIRVNWWVVIVITAVGLVLNFMVFGERRGLIYAVLFFVGLFVACVFAYSIWAAREVPRLRKGLAESEQDRKARGERISQLERVVERVRSGAGDIRQGTGLQRMIGLMHLLISEIDSATQYKRIEQVLGKRMFPVTQLTWRSDRNVIEACVVFGTEPPFVEGQEVDYFMASVRVGSASVVRLDGHSATVQLDGKPLPPEVFDQLETLTTIDVAETYVALPVLEGLKGYTAEELVAMRHRLEDAYQLLISLLEGGPV